jgi:hypothetical protein
MHLTAKDVKAEKCGHLIKRHSYGNLSNAL